MIISVSFDRKVGQPNYSSVGASCRIEWDADPAAEPLAAQIRAIQDQCERVVAEQLARFGADGGAASPPPSAPSRPRPPAADQAALTESSYRQPSHYHTGGNRVPSRAVMEHRPPVVARELYPWLKHLEESGNPGLLRKAKTWASDNGLPWKTQDWPVAAVLDFVAIVLEQMEAVHV